MSGAEKITVEVVLAMQNRVQRKMLTLSIGTQAREAVLVAQAQGVDFKNTGVLAESAPLGIYAERVDDDYVLADGDRLEVYRPLEQDPMELRRQRAARSTRAKQGNSGSSRN